MTDALINIVVGFFAIGAGMCLIDLTIKILEGPPWGK